ncbi:hypothetical protein IWQ61_005712 [Dispira simplex]|nr:hypothetical protein IWQ61_005712 [Dispira simplex]
MRFLFRSLTYSSLRFRTQQGLSRPCRYTTDNRPLIKPPTFWQCYGTPILNMFLYSSAVAYSYHVLFQFLLNHEIKEEKAEELARLRATLDELQAQVDQTLRS